MRIKKIHNGFLPFGYYADVSYRYMQIYDIYYKIRYVKKYFTYFTFPFKMLYIEYPEWKLHFSTVESH